MGSRVRVPSRPQNAYVKSKVYMAVDSENPIMYQCYRVFAFRGILIYFLDIEISNSMCQFNSTLFNSSNSSSISLKIDLVPKAGEKYFLLRHSHDFLLAIKLSEREHPDLLKLENTSQIVK